MAARMWEGTGWLVFGTTSVGMAAYMFSVGWDRANLIAGIGGFFVAFVGLALAVAAHGSARPPVSRHEQKLAHSSAGKDARQQADVPHGVNRPGFDRDLSWWL